MRLQNVWRRSVSEFDSRQRVNGDTGTDMQTGKAAGMLTVGVLWGYRTKDELIANGADLLLETPKDIWKIYREKKDD